MSRKLRYGMVGGGPGAFIGDTHRRAINLDGMAELVAGSFSRDAQKTIQQGEILGLDPTRCYPNYADMAKAEAAREDGIDFVVIVTPNHLHFDVCKAFIQHGIHVSCDKPLCVSVEQADELECLAAEKDILFLVTYTYMGYVCTRHIREIIRRGDIGKIRMVAAEYPQAWLAHEGDFGGKQGQWRCDPAQSGGSNCLGDIGTHVENAVSWMTGLKVKRVLAKMDKLVPGRVLDDNDIVMVEYDGGGSGMYWTSQVALGHDNGLRVRIYGSDGAIEWYQEEPEKITLVSRDGDITILHRGHKGIAPGAAAYQRVPSGHPEGLLEAMGNLYEGFIRAIIAKRAGTLTDDMIDFPTVHEGAQGIRYIQACLDSANQGNVWVEL